MGQVLDKPIIEKNYDSGEGNGLKFAAAGMQGWRMDMEDAHAALPSLEGSFANVSYYAVFDGHAGSYTSSICAEKLHEEILKSLRENGFSEIPAGMDEEKRAKLSKALADAFVRFDDGLRQSEVYATGKESCGTTALACLVTPDYVIFCNCGDSRGFLARKGEVFFQTKDHKPADPVEKKRIEDSGGSVIMDRVNGNLAVSRAIGDFSFKDKSDLDLREQAVSPEPTVTIIDREKEEFILLACDGIWDVMNCERVRAFTDFKLRTTDKLTEIMSDLISACLILDSRDNMTCMIITFSDQPKVLQQDVDIEKSYIEEIRKSLKEYVEKSAQSSTVVGAYEHLSGLTFEETSASLLGPCSQIRVIEQVLDELEPDRVKDKDFTPMQNFNSFPVSLQAIQQLVRREPMGDSGAASSPEDSSHDVLAEELDTEDSSEHSS